MKYIPLVQVCDFQGGSQPPKDQWIDHEKEGYIRMLQIRDFTQPDKDNIEFIRISKTIKTCNEDDILIGRYGASVGKILTGLAGAYNVAIIKTIPDTSKLSKRFLYHYLNSPYFQNFILSVGSRAAQAGFNKDDLSDAQIPDLSLEEQSNVVSQLDKVTELIALRKEQLAKLDQLVKSRFIELFGDSVTNSMGWDTDTVIGVCDDIYGGGTPSKSHPEYYENGDIPWVSSKDMKTDVLYDSQIKINQLGVDNSTAKMVPINSVIMVIRSGILKHTLPVAVNAVPITVNQDLKVFIPSNRILSIFLMHQFKMLEKDILSGVRAVTADNIEFDSLKKREIIVPPMELQEQFAAFVEQTDKSKLAIQQSLDKLETLKKSLMQEYFG